MVREHYYRCEAWILCYSVVDRKSLNILRENYVEHRRKQKHDASAWELFGNKPAPVILVGNKLDLAPAMLEYYVSPEEAEKAAKEIGATVSVQCSSFAQLLCNAGNVDIAFKAAIKSAVEYDQHRFDHEVLECCVTM